MNTNMPQNYFFFDLTHMDMENKVYCTREKREEEEHVNYEGEPITVFDSY